MKTRLTKTKAKVFQGDCGGSSTSTGLDENLWSTLQHHIDLAENVYSRLPFEEFFHLRIVCKDWYVIACKRLGLKEPIHKPFFTLFTEGEYGRLDRILFYNASTQSWDWRQSFFYHYPFKVVASKGVVYSAQDRFCGNRASVFCWQSKKCQCQDLPPTLPNFYQQMIIGLTLSDHEKQDPFSSFRVVCGSPDFDTQVYESGVWQTKPCQVPKSEMGVPVRKRTRCVDCNGRVYITTEFSPEIFVYDFEKARWNSLSSPGDRFFKHQPPRYCLNTLGAWDSHIFDVTCVFQSWKNWSLQVWEPVDEEMCK